MRAIQISEFGGPEDRWVPEALFGGDLLLAVEEAGDAVDDGVLPFAGDEQSGDNLVSLAFLANQT